MGQYDGSGEVKGGGFFVHYRDSFGRCQWAIATARTEGASLNLQVISNGPDQLTWKPNVKHGPDKGCWHWPNQCAMDRKQMRDDEINAGSTKSAAHVENMNRAAGKV